MIGDVTPTFFAKPAAWRRWLEQNHAKETSIVIGFYKTSTERRSITWPESVDAALCFGWIDGVHKRIENKSRIYAYEQCDVATLTHEEDTHFRSHPIAWKYYSTRAPSYRQRTLWWIVCAKQATTRASRLEKLIVTSAEQRTL